jgi:hypothetical protein
VYGECRVGRRLAIDEGDPIECGDAGRETLEAHPVEPAALEARDRRLVDADAVAELALRQAGASPASHAARPMISSPRWTRGSCSSASIREVKHWSIAWQLRRRLDIPPTRIQNGSVNLPAANPSAGRLQNATIGLS